MRPVTFLAVMLIAGCTSGSRPVAVATPTPTAQASASPSALESPSALPTPSQSPSPSATAGTTVALTDFGRSLRCSLPVAWADYPGAKGFLDLPASTPRKDPRAAANAVFYDRAFDKWLSVPRDAVSPDGTKYAYGDHRGDLGTGPASSVAVHVVNVATGADRVIYSQSGSFGFIYSVVDFAPEGIYLTAQGFEGRSHGLWLLNSAGGQPRLINGAVETPAVGGGAGWGLDFNSADRNPAPGGLQGPVNRLLRVDLRTGATTPWLYLPGTDLVIIGLDAAGEPMVDQFQPSAVTWLVTSRNVATRLLSSSDADPSPLLLEAIDQHGVWLEGGNGATSRVWIYAGGSIRTVLTAPGYFSVAGGCIP